MLANTDITVYNVIKSGKETLYIGTQLKNVSLRGLTGGNYSDNNITDNDSYTLRISLPAQSDKQYIPSKSYSLLASAEFFTVQKGDYVVKGLVYDKICTPSELIKKYGDDVMRITAVSDNSVTLSPYLSHIKAVVK